MKEIVVGDMKKIQINILDLVAKYCNKENLRYFLAYGSLLGAVRHKGYIPWDDDIDILMPRPDYEKFVKNFNIDIEEYKVYAHSNDPEYNLPFAKVSYNKTLLIEKTDIKFDKIGINIDIFPIDGLPDSEIEQKKIVKSITMQRNLLNVKSISISSERLLYKNIILYLGKFFFSLLNYRKIIEKINHKATMLSYDQSKYVGCLVWNYGYKEIMTKNIFSNQTELEFEGKNYCVPGGYNEFLVNIYGDYMKLPPESERATHHSFSAYWK